MENFGKVEYYPPQKALEKAEDPHHHFDFIIDNVKAGSAEVDYLSKPLPCYQLTSLYVEEEFQSKGYASEIMDVFEKFLRDKKKPGFLADAIWPHAPAAGMYQRRGWKLVPDTYGLYSYNLPDDIDYRILIGYENRYTSFKERGK